MTTLDRMIAQALRERAGHTVPANDDIPDHDSDHDSDDDMDMDMDMDM